MSHNKYLISAGVVLLTVLFLASDFGPQLPRNTTNTSSDDTTQGVRLRQGEISCPYNTQFRIDLSYQEETDASAEAILQTYATQCSREWVQLTVLTLQLDGNNITSLAILLKPLSTIPNLQNLTVYLQNNQIDNAGVEVADRLLKNNPQLVQFQMVLYSNKITDTYAFRLAFEPCRKLRFVQLDFSFNGIKDIVFAATAFQTLTNLRTLQLVFGYNQVHDLAPLSVAFESLGALEQVNIDFYDNGIDSIQALSKTFAKQTNLTDLSLSLGSNSIFDVTPLSTAFDNLRALRSWKLYLVQNDIGNGLDALIDAINRNIGQRQAFCPFQFNAKNNPFTQDQIDKLNALKNTLQSEFDNSECTTGTKSFQFQI